MKRTPRQLLSIFCCSLLLSGASAPAFAQPGIATRGRHGARLPLLRGAPALSARLSSPAFGGVSFIKGNVAPLAWRGAAGPLAASLPLAAPSAATLGLRPSAVPFARFAAPGPISAAAFSASRESGSKFAALSSARDLAGRLAGPGGLGNAGAISRERFDGALVSASARDEGDAAPAVPAAPEPSAAPATPAAPAVPVAANGIPLDKLYPRVVFLLDVFQEPISDRFARYLDTLVEQKVQVVILTDRPESGPSSISEVVLSKLKARRANGVIVVANNGGKIFAYSNSRAQSHAPLVPNVEGFSEPALSAFGALNQKLAGEYGIPLPIETRYDDGKGKAAATLSYSLSLPRAMMDRLSPRSNKLKADQWQERMNKGLKTAGVPYSFELFVDKRGGMSAVTHATPLRGSLGRIREALKKAMNGDDFLQDRPGETLIIANPEWWKSFQRQPELKKVNFLGAKTAAQAENQIGAMLGDLSLEQVYVDRYQVESYVRWKHYQSRGDRSGGGYRGGGGGGIRASKDGLEMGPLYLWRAAIVSKILELIGKELRDGSWRRLKDRTLDRHVYQLFRGRKLQAGAHVYLPFANPAVAKARGKSLWSRYAGDHLGYAQKFVRNLRDSLLPAFPADADDFGQTIHRLGSESTSRTTLFFRNLLTGRMYKVGIRVPMSRIENTPQGQTFYGQVPRTGKQVPEVDDFTAKMMALALLKADGVAQKADRWYVNHRPLEQIVIEFHYYRVTIPYRFTPAELVGVEQVVTNSIEKMLADEEFLKHYEETMGEQGKGKAGARAGKKAAPKRAAKPEPKKKRTR